MVAMVAKFMFLRPHSSTSYLLLSPPSFRLNLLYRCTISTAAAVVPPAVQSSTHSIAATHGPSLCKGNLISPIMPRPSSHDTGSLRIPPNNADDDVGDVCFDGEQFTRVYDIAALRVPSEHCYALETRLRGHLLNWPRIRNIARVPGDEIEEGFQDLLSVRNGTGANDEAMRSLNRRINGKAEGDGEELSPVLYRDKLSKEFNSRGFVRFRNLAKISRPKRKKKKKEGQESEDEIDKRARRESVTVEVVEKGDEEGDLSGLLGDEFKGRRWRCSTRLLLLDEKYAMKQPDELPEAVKVQWWIL